MNSRRYTLRIQRHCTSLRLVLAIVCSVAIVLGQAMPAMAGFASNGSGIWVEICSDGKTYLAEIGQEGEKSHECTHCPLCLVWNGDLQLSHPSDSSRTQPDYTTATHSFDLAKLNAGPEQYWSLCRGPPILSVEKHMTSQVSLNTQGTGPDGVEIMRVS